MLTIHRPTPRTTVIDIPDRDVIEHHDGSPLPATRDERDRPRDRFEQVLNREWRTLAALSVVFIGLVGALVIAAWMWL